MKGFLAVDGLLRSREVFVLIKDLENLKDGCRLRIGSYGGAGGAGKDKTA